jgi:tRNA-dihydrouridine synthase
MTNFWNTLPSGFMVLAPMEDVTDTVFRRVVASCGQKDATAGGKVGKDAGQPDVYFTEFTNCDGIMSVGQSRVIHRLKYTESERPLVAQIWGKTPENYFQTAKLIKELGFDGVDINMGCPERNVIKQGACSALIKNQPLANEIIQAVKSGVGGDLPVSVKTRIGFDTLDTESWTSFLLDQDIQALTLHGRTVKEMSEAPVHWDEIAKVVGYRNQKKLTTKIIGNGDILSWAQAGETIKNIGLDGVMIGRGVFKNPFVFNRSVVQDEKGNLFRNNVLIEPKEKLMLLYEHTKLWCDTWKVDENSDDYYRNNKTVFKYQKNISTLKKFYKIYCSGFTGAVELRIKLMETEDIGDVIKVLNESGHINIV